MAALDTVEVKEGVDQDTVDAVRNSAGRINTAGTPRSRWNTRPKGVNTDIVRLISSKNEEPEWMTEWRLDAFERWDKIEEPTWAMVDYPEIDFQDQYYYARPKSMEDKPKSLDEVDPKLLATYEKLGIPLKEQMILAGVEGAEDMPAEGRKVAVDAVFDSVSLGTTFQAELEKAGVIFLFDFRGDRRASRAGEEISGLGCAAVGQLLCDAEFGCVFRRFIRLHPARRALPDGAEHVFPHQRRKHRPVRTHADHRRQGLLCVLS